MWVLILYFYTGLTSVPGFPTEETCKIAAVKTKELGGGLTYNIKAVCVRLGG